MGSGPSGSAYGELCLYIILSSFQVSLKQIAKALIRLHMRAV